jgi:lipopolysaccharide transport protein LptA
MIPMLRNILLCAAFLAAAPLHSQETPAPSMTANEGAGARLFNPLGGDRPKGAATEITASEKATFDNEKNVAEFTGRVVVRDPQFTLSCEKLVVRLNSDRNGIDVAEAKGNVVIVQEKADPADTSPKAIGRAADVTYKPSTGEITLRGWPSIQQGINNQVATEQSTVMILKSSGESRTIGGSKTLITDSTSPQP